MNTILHCLLVDVAVAIAVTTMYCLTDEIALSIIYGNNKMVFEKSYYQTRLMSIFIVGLIPVLGMVVMCWWMWTFADRVESFVWSILKLTKRKRGVIVKKESAKKWQGYQ